jgi:hypothetical protein
MNKNIEYSDKYYKYVDKYNKLLKKISNDISDGGDQICDLRRLNTEEINNFNFYKIEGEIIDKLTEGNVKDFIRDKKLTKLMDYEPKNEVRVCKSSFEKLKEEIEEEAIEDERRNYLFNKYLKEHIEVHLNKSDDALIKLRYEVIEKGLVKLLKSGVISDNLKKKSSELLNLIKSRINFAKCQKGIEEKDEGFIEESKQFINKCKSLVDNTDSDLSIDQKRKIQKMIREIKRMRKFKDKCDNIDQLSEFLIECGKAHVLSENNYMRLISKRNESNPILLEDRNCDNCDCNEEYCKTCKRCKAYEYLKDQALHKKQPKLTLVVLPQDEDDILSFESVSSDPLTHSKDKKVTQNQTFEYGTHNYVKNELDILTKKFNADYNYYDDKKEIIKFDPKELKNIENIMKGFFKFFELFYNLGSDKQLELKFKKQLELSIKFCKDFIEILLEKCGSNKCIPKNLEKPIFFSGDFEIFKSLKEYDSKYNFNIGNRCVSIINFAIDKYLEILFQIKKTEPEKNLSKIDSLTEALKKETDYKWNKYYTVNIYELNCIKAMEKIYYLFYDYVLKIIKQDKEYKEKEENDRQKRIEDNKYKSGQELELATLHKYDRDMVKRKIDGYKKIKKYKLVKK